MGIPWYVSAWMVYIFDIVLVLVIVIFLLLAVRDDRKSPVDEA